MTIKNTISLVILSPVRGRSPGQCLGCKVANETHYTTHDKTITAKIANELWSMISAQQIQQNCDVLEAINVNYR